MVLFEWVGGFDVDYFWDVTDMSSNLERREMKNIFE